MRDFLRVAAIAFLVTVVVGYCALAALQIFTSFIASFPN